jgi:PEP-CTERM motif
MKPQRLCTACWCSTLALAALFTAVAPAISRGGTIAVAEILPNTGFQATHTIGIHGIDFSQSDAVDPLLPGESYGPFEFRLTTPDGRFTLDYFIGASDNFGIPGLTVTGDVFNNLGGQGSLVVGFDQRYDPSRIFANGCLDGAALVGTFTEPAVHGNNIVGQASVGGVGLPPLAAADRGPAAFNVNTGYLGPLPPPNDLQALLTYNFGPTSTPGDEISIPFTFNYPSAVPEPASLSLALMAVLAGAGVWWRRRSAVA